MVNVLWNKMWNKKCKMGNPTSTYVWHFNKGFDFIFSISKSNSFQFGIYLMLEGEKISTLNLFQNKIIFYHKKILPILDFWHMSFKPMPIMKINLFFYPLFSESGHHYINETHLSYVIHFYNGKHNSCFIPQKQLIWIHVNYELK